MSYAPLSYTGDGVTTDYAITWEYLAGDDVTVFVGGAPTAYTLLSASLLQISPAPADEAIIKVVRGTADDIRNVVFANVVSLTAGKLNRSADQLFYMAQEAVATANAALTLDAVDEYDVDGHVISNVSDPVDAGDAVNKGYLVSQTAASLAAVAANVVLSHADVVLTGLDVDTTNADVLLTAADAASTASNAALTAADVVLTGLDVDSTNADVLLTAANAALTAADVVTISGSAAATAADAVLTAADVVTISGSAAATTADAVLTAADVALTHADVVLTHADVVLTGADVDATNADVVLTHADAVSTAADAVATAAALTAASLPTITVPDAAKLLAVNVAGTAYELIPPASGVAAGIGGTWDGITPPTGWLEKDGSAVAVASYADLAAAIYCGDTDNPTAEWGYRCTNDADPTNTRSTTGDYIVLPDMRGEFARGWDNGRGVDSSRSLWAYQAEEIQDHDHGGTTGNGGSHAHTYNRPNLSSGSALGGSSGVSSVSSGIATSTAPNHNHTIPGSGGAETRPRNAATMFIIKY